MSGRELAEQMTRFAARWRKSMCRGYGAEIYEIDGGAPGHVVLTVQMVEAGAEALRRIEALEAERARLRNDCREATALAAYFEGWSHNDPISVEWRERYKIFMADRAALKGGSDD